MNEPEYLEMKKKVEEYEKKQIFESTVFINYLGIPCDMVNKKPLTKGRKIKVQKRNYYIGGNKIPLIEVCEK